MTADGPTVSAGAGIINRVDDKPRDRRTAKPWVRVAAPVVGVALGFAVFQVFLDDEPECGGFSTRTYDGTVVAGGPQSAEQALSGFLGSGAADGTPVEGLTLDDLTSTEPGDGYVVFQKGHDEDEVIVVVTKQRDGWTVSEVSQSC